MKQELRLIIFRFYLVMCDPAGEQESKGQGVVGTTKHAIDVVIRLSQIKRQCDSFWLLAGCFPRFGCTSIDILRSCLLCRHAVYILDGFTHAKQAKVKAKGILGSRNPT